MYLIFNCTCLLRRVIIGQIGYERICKELDTMTIDSGREYTSIEIEKVDIEPMVLLKIICPSTDRIHILRVPPEMISAEAAMTWINHNIHPNNIGIQT
jgi:leucine-rich repeat protein SHOC2